MVHCIPCFTVQVQSFMVLIASVHSFSLFPVSHVNTSAGTVSEAVPHKAEKQGVLKALTCKKSSSTSHSCYSDHQNLVLLR